MPIVLSLPDRLKGLILAPQPCRQCGHPGPHVVTEGKGPHKAALRCGQCGTFVQWLGQMALDVLTLADEAEVGHE